MNIPPSNQLEQEAEAKVRMIVALLGGRVHSGANQLIVVGVTKSHRFVSPGLLQFTRGFYSWVGALEGIKTIEAVP